MSAATLAFAVYLATFVALIVLQFIRASGLRRLLRHLNELRVGERLSSSLAHQLKLLHMPVPSTTPDVSAELARERKVYRHLTYVCLFLLAVLIAFPFMAHRIWPLG
jgi:hypothetical protein